MIQSVSVPSLQHHKSRDKERNHINVINNSSVPKSKLSNTMNNNVSDHCTKKLLTTSEIVNIYHETCKQISKDTTFGIKEWEKVILHFGITIPIDNESGNIIKMGEGGEETNL